MRFDGRPILFKTYLDSIVSLMVNWDRFFYLSSNFYQSLTYPPPADTSYVYASDLGNVLGK